jgi:hypothetical protein
VGVGGDPTGTGAGGSSAWGKPFRDEFDSRLIHDTRGVLSMANSGENTNNSQFFFTYRPAAHLDLKHAVFGKIVGGISTLDVMERIPTDGNEKPTEDIVVLGTQVFVNPIPEADANLVQAIHDSQARRTHMSRAAGLPTRPTSSSVPSALTNVSAALPSAAPAEIPRSKSQARPAPTVGKYMTQSNASKKRVPRDDSAAVAAFLRSQGGITSEAETESDRKRKRTDQGGSFSNW